jgi:outer membrane murein-binding lipoprotein Lpp
VKRTIATVVAGALVFAGGASAATPTQRIAALEKSVKALKKTVAKQNKSIKTLASALEANFVADGCIVAVTADAIQSTWANFDSVFGPQQTITDRNACSLLRNPTVSRQGIQPQPTPEVFGQLITWLIPSSQHVLR